MLESSPPCTLRVSCSISFILFGRAALLVALLGGHAELGRTVVLIRMAPTDRRAVAGRLGAMW